MSTMPPVGLALGFALALLAGACEHGIILRGQVQVDAELQRRFSKDAPGILVVGGGFGKGTLDAQLLAVLCDPGDQPLTAPFHIEQLGCARPGTAWFRLTRLHPADRAQLTCGVQQQGFDLLINTGRVTVPDSIADVVATTNVPIFADKDGACENADQTITATMK
jgi:hypothetical protein